MLKVFLNYAYMICMASALCFHVFNTIQISEEIKVFHLFACISMVISLYLGDFKNRIGRFLIAFLSISLLSSFLAYRPVWSAFCSLSIIWIASYHLRNVNVRIFFRIANIAILISLIGLLIHYFSELFYRFQGFYNDPNYLCTTLLLFLYIVSICLLNENGLVFKIVYIIELILIILLVSTTLSRTGIFCCFIILLVGFINEIIHRFKYIIILFLMSIFLLYISDKIQHIQSFVEQQYEQFYDRVFERNDNLASAGNLRRDLSIQGVDFVLSNPSYLLGGIGIGNTDDSENSIIPNKLWNRDHNTYTSVFTEQGILAFVFFIYMQFLIYRICSKCNDIILRRFKLFAFMSLQLFSFSIWQINYLPWVMMLFTLSNEHYVSNQK